MKNTKPNLFKYATSELSQDAFICWLIAWSDKSNQSINPKLNKCAISFVQKLLQEDENYKIENIEVGRQWKKIDVWALINNEYFLVIEDKKATTSHSDQLKRYADTAKKHYENEDIKIKLVYFKMEEQGQYDKVNDAGFIPFHRKDMLNILSNNVAESNKEEQNDILSDFYENLISLDQSINSYKTNELNKWSANSWKGFYSEIQKEIRGSWKYISNPRGGFLGFYWNWREVEVEGIKFQLYLQLEQNKLTFKMYAYQKNQRNKARSIYRKHLYKKAKEKGIVVGNFGRIGEFMSVAKLKTEYRKLNKNNNLDFKKTVKELNKIMELLDETVSSLNGK